MTSQGNGQPIQYRVIASQQVRQIANALYQRARQNGRSKRFVSSLRAIYEHLQNRPDQFGEALYQLPVLKLMVY
jgi:hypothetical protein